MEQETKTKVSKLAKRVKEKLSIQNDEDVGDWDQLKTSFPEHFQPQVITKFTRKSMEGGSKRKGNPLCLHTDMFCDGSTMLCGFNDGVCKILTMDNLSSDDSIIIDRKNEWSHQDLSFIRCSRTSPFLFFTSSENGEISTWDARQSKRKPCQTFSSGNSNASATDNNKSSKSASPQKPQRKPILKFDISCNDQLLCAGTEKVQDDSYLLFWDVRSSNLLGAYWESHSDDVTAIKFHPSQAHTLASGSTDGLLNVFNLLEPQEDDSLQFSFNTNSSIDSVHWHSANDKEGKVSCITHTNEFQVWDAISGDRIAEFGRKSIADAMMRRNPDTVYITSCHTLDASRVGLMTCPLAGGNARIIELNSENQLIPRSLFLDQTTVVQAAQIVSNAQQWVTFDENGLVKVWKLDEALPSKEKFREERRSKARFKPYQRD